MVQKRWGRDLQSLRVKRVTPGGETRQGSVQRGLDLTDASSELVAIHDAVRPLVRPERIEEALRAAARVGAALLAAPVKATIKRATPDLAVRDTIPRSGLWEAQTPQVFRRDLILRAYRRAEADRFQATDDAELVERLGCEVAIVESSDENLKITTPSDLLVAEALLASRGESS